MYHLCLCLCISVPMPTQIREPLNITIQNDSNKIRWQVTLCLAVSCTQILTSMPMLDTLTNADAEWSVARNHRGEKARSLIQLLLTGQGLMNCEAMLASPLTAWAVLACT